MWSKLKHMHDLKSNFLFWVSKLPPSTKTTCYICWKIKWQRHHNVLQRSRPTPKDPTTDTITGLDRNWLDLNFPIFFWLTNMALGFRVEWPPVGLACYWCRQFHFCILINWQSRDEKPVSKSTCVHKDLAKGEKFPITEFCSSLGVAFYVWLTASLIS